MLIIGEGLSNNPHIVLEAEMLVQKNDINLRFFLVVNVGEDVSRQVGEPALKNSIRQFFVHLKSKANVVIRNLTMRGNSNFIPGCYNANRWRFSAPSCASNIIKKPT